MTNLAMTLRDHRQWGDRPTRSDAVFGRWTYGSVRVGDVARVRASLILWGERLGCGMSYGALARSWGINRGTLVRCVGHVTEWLEQDLQFRAAAVRLVPELSALVADLDL